MKKPKTYTLPGHTHIQQFHNAHHHPLTDDTRTMWWEMDDSPREPRASGGSVIAALRGSRSPDRLMRLHPAMNIPGVHIRTAEAGEPLFNRRG